MSQNLEKTYNPKEIEDKLYQKWCENKYFHAEVDRSKKPFTIVMPPPNITGKLHMGLGTQLVDSHSHRQSVAHHPCRNSLVGAEGEHGNHGVGIVRPYA